MNEWLKSNLWHIITTSGLVLLMIGQYVERQDGVAASVQGTVQRLEARVNTIESWVSQERPWLDLVYVAREVSLAQNAEILRRLDSIENEQRQLRVLLQRR